MHFFGGSASRGADKVMEATEACMFGCGSYYVIFTCCFVMFHVLRAILVLEYNVQPVIPPTNGENGMAGSCTQVPHVFKQVSHLAFICVHALHLFFRVIISHSIFAFVAVIFAFILGILLHRSYFSGKSNGSFLSQSGSPE